jgi:hypothetical protein
MMKKGLLVVLLLVSLTEYAHAKLECGFEAQLTSSVSDSFSSMFVKNVFFAGIQICLEDLINSPRGRAILKYGTIAAVVGSGSYFLYNYLRQNGYFRSPDKQYKADELNDYDDEEEVVSLL